MTTKQNPSLQSPSCYFCNTIVLSLFDDRGSFVKVQAADETPAQAQMRWVCRECNPRKE